jgi:hypothetical protein
MSAPRLLAAVLLSVCVTAPRASSAQEKEKLTFEPSGWLVLNTWANSGATNSVDLPQFAVRGDTEEFSGLAVRQSRLRANIGIPTDGALFNSKMKGFVEIDFMGGNASNGVDDSLPLPRLRHAWVQAAWKDTANLAVTLGQTWGIFGGPYFADSLSHLAVPRFGGSGFLFRRAPQARVSGELGQKWALGFAGGVLAPLDRNKANDASPYFVGARAAAPNVEARLAGLYRPAPKLGADVGVSVHYGQEKYQLNGVAGAPDEKLTSRGLSLDAKLDLPYVTLKGAGYVGENLDVIYSFAPGVVQTSNAAKELTSVSNVTTRGFWAQGVVSPAKTVPLQLLVGGGLEQPRTLAPNAQGVAPLKNRQLSGGAIYSLTSRWRAAVEFTNYVTDTTAGRFEANQLEISTLLAL